MKPWLVVVAVLVAFGAITRATPVVLPLSDPNDPVRLSDAEFSVDDQVRGTISVHIENATSGPLTTGQIWVTTSRFFTKSDMIRKGDRVVFNCGKMAHADIDAPEKAIPPGAKVQVKMLVDPGCTIDLQYDHFFVIVNRISTVAGRYGSFAWNREPGELSRLLQAAMPHP